MKLAFISVFLTLHYANRNSSCQSLSYSRLYILVLFVLDGVFELLVH